METLKVRYKFEPQLDCLVKFQQWYSCLFIFILLGEFEKLRKATISFIMSVGLSLSLSLSRSVGFQWTDFHEICYLSTFLKYADNIMVLLKYEKNNFYFFHIRTVHLEIIKVLFIHQLMHWWIVLKNSIKIYIKIYFKTAASCFGVTITPSSGSTLICSY